MTTDPRELFEQAADESGETRARLLRQVLDSGDEELRAVALCQLALTGDVLLSDAATAVRQAAVAGWPNYHLAEAAMAQADYRLVLDQLGRIPEGFFESRGLRWRAVRGLELEAIANVGLGDWARTAAVVDRLAVEYGREADEDDLASPSQLVRALLGPPGGQRVGP